MKKISTYSIQHQQKMFNLPVSNKDFFFVEIGKSSLFYPEPRRSETYSISYLKEGAIYVQAGLYTQLVTAPAIITLGPTVVRTMQEDPENPPVMQILFFKDSFLLANRTNVFYLMGFDFFEKDDRHYCKPNTEATSRIARIFNFIKDTVQSGHLHEAEIVRSSTFILINEADAVHRQQGGSITVTADNLQPLVVNFKKLLYKEYRSQRTVQFYADRLNITPKHLSEQLKKFTGKTAGEWIDEAIILEAKVLLQNKKYSVAEVSAQLNFADQSVFGKFFKAHTQFTPLQYRKSAL